MPSAIHLPQSPPPMHDSSLSTRLFIRPSPFLMATMVMTCMLLNGGCYERVVGVKGPNADAYDVYEPSVKSDRDPNKIEPYTVPSKTVRSKTVPSQKAKE